MPLYLNEVDVASEIQGARSVLIVPCRMCPATSLAARNNRPFFEFFKTLFRSPPLEEYIKTLKSRLEESGKNTGVFLPRQFLACAWTSGQRNRLQKKAEQYDAVIVLGCESATESARDALKSIDCKVVQGMRVEGIVNVKVRFHLPGTLSLEDCKIISVSKEQ